MSTKKKTPAKLPGLKEWEAQLAEKTADAVKYEYDVAHLEDGWAAGIRELGSPGPDRVVIVKGGMPTEAAAAHWAEEHCNLRNYRPFARA